MKLINLNRSAISLAIIAILFAGFDKVEADDIDMLIKQLQDKEWQVRQSAAEALGKIGDSRTVEPLIICLKDRVWEVRRSAVEALGEIGDSRAVEPLISRLKDRVWKVRRSAVEALGEIGDSRAVEPLISRLKDRVWEVRGSATEALGEIGDSRAVKPLISRLKDRVWEVRGSAAEALGEIGDSRAVKPLISRLKDGIWHGDGLAAEVSCSAAEALGKIGDSHAVKPLVSRMKAFNEYPKVRRSAAEALGEIGDTNAIPHLVSALSDWYINEEICSALNKMDWLPKSDDEQVYSWIVAKDKYNLLSQWEQTKRVLLNDMISDEGRKIENAVYTFICLGREEIIDELVRILDKKGNKVMAETCLNCGNIQLYYAAKRWAARHGYYISPGSGSCEASWGIW